MPEGVKNVPLQRLPSTRNRINAVRVVHISYLFAVAILGVLLLGVSVWMASVRLWPCPVLNIYYIAMWLCLGSGLIMMLVAMGGMLLVSQGRGLGKLMIVIGVVVAALIVILVLSAKFGTDADEGKVVKQMHTLFLLAKEEFIDQKRGEKKETSHSMNCWENFQTDYQCCGVLGFDDWTVLANHTFAKILRPFQFNRSEIVHIMSATNIPTLLGNDTSELLNRSLANDTDDNYISDGSSMVSVFVGPQSCICTPGQSSSNATCTTAPGSLLVYRGGCGSHVAYVVGQHLMVLKVLSPIVLIFLIILMVSSVYFSVRANRLFVVDIYSPTEQRPQQPAALVLRVRNPPEQYPLSSQSDLQLCT